MQKINEVDRKIALWIDHGPLSGMGHLSRCRGLIEFLSQKQEYSIEIYGADCVGGFPNSWWLSSNCHFSNLGLGDALRIPALVADTYDAFIQRQISERKYGRAALIVDSNFEAETIPPNVLQIKLEVFNESQREEKVKSSLIANRIEGTLFWSSKLEEVLLERAQNKYQALSHKKTIVVSFGGSAKTLPVFELLIGSLEKIANSGIANIEIFCSNEVRDNLIAKIKLETKIVIHEFNESFYNKIRICDLLICGSGTTAIEAYHLAIPSIVIKLFDNARHNFDNLRDIFLDAKFIDINDKNFIDEIYTLIISQLESVPKQEPNKRGVVDSKHLEEVFQFLTRGPYSQQKN
jgi:spore coat polysaccharide biosynthesis predicted glycosyltransferase SpsG